MVSATELQKELFNQPLPPFEQIKKYAAAANSSERGRNALCQKAEEGGDALSCGITLWLCGKPEQAEACLKKAKDCVQKLLVIGCIFRDKGEYDKALSQFDQAAKSQAEVLTAAMEKAETCRRADRLEQAKKELKTCANFENVSAEYHYQLGRILENEGQYEQSAAQYETAVNLDPTHVQALFQLAYTNDLRGDEELAIEYYKQAIKIAPPHVNALLNLAVLYEDRGEYDKALQCVNAVLRSHPNHAKAALFKKDIESSRVMIYDEEREKRKDRQSKIFEIPISDFELSVRSRNCLRKMNLITLGDLLRTSEAELLSYKNFGETSLMEIKKILDSKGLRLGMALETKGPAAALGSEELGEGAGPEILNKSVDELELSVRARRAMVKLDIKTLFELVGKTEAELLGCKNFGVTSLNEIKEKLAHFGLSLRKLD
jgi:DNA-directed RNA polymerase subunit alpha